MKKYIQLVKSAIITHLLNLITAEENTVFKEIYQTYLEHLAT